MVERAGAEHRQFDTVEARRPDEVEPVFAQPVLESRGLLRWAYITRWDELREDLRRFLDVVRAEQSVRAAHQGYLTALGALRATRVAVTAEGAEVLHAQRRRAIDA